MPTQPGRVVGSYQIEGMLGRGGMGVVYRARDLRLDRPVALKLLADFVAGDQRYRDRFLRERRAAAAIDHPNVLPVYEAGEADGELFIAMRLVEGEDLEALLEHDGPLDPARAAGLIAQVADALDAIHLHGLVHRDVKPSNVLLHTAGAREHAYVTDFGIAKLSADATPLTDTGSFMGTVDYCAPEVIRGDVLDARADVYALGCVLVECLTGAKPFPRDTQLAVIYAHMEDPPPSVRELRPELPAALDDVVARALAKDPAERFQSAGELAGAVNAALGAGPRTGTATVARAKPVTPKPPGEPPRRRLPLFAGLAGLALVLVVVAVVALSGGGGGGGGGDTTTRASTATTARTASRAPATGGRIVVGAKLAGARGDSGYCSGGGKGEAACTMLQRTIDTADQAVPADGVITSWAVRDGRGRLGLRVIDDRTGQGRVVAAGPNVRVSGSGVQRFAVRIPVARGQYIGVELGTDGYLPIRYRSDATRVDKWQPPLGTRPAAPLASASGADGYEQLYNATIEPDDDHDGRGDLTQDPDHGGTGAKCPTEGVAAKGSGSSVVTVDDKLYGCRGGVRTLVGTTGGNTTYPRFTFNGDQLGVVRVDDGKSSILVFDLGDRTRTFATDKTFDDNRPTDWRVTDLVVAKDGDAAWISIPKGAPDRAGLWTNSHGKVEQQDSGALKPGTLGLHPAEHGASYTDADGRDRNIGFQGG